MLLSYFAAIAMLQLKKKKLKRTTLTLLVKSEDNITGSINNRYEAMVTSLQATSRLTKCQLCTKTEATGLPVMSKEQNNSY